MADGGWLERTRAAYDQVAKEYAARIYDELSHKPFDRELLDRFAERLRGQGRVCDLGCGPGHVARYLHERGCDVLGVDLSTEMVAMARELNPEISFLRGDMLALDVQGGAWAGIAAMYSIVNLPRDQVAPALAEMHRVLGPGCALVLAFHIGDGTIHLDEWWGLPVSVDFTLFTADEIGQHLHAVGFEIEESIEREPYPDVEHPTRRAYIVAHRAPSATPHTEPIESRIA